MPLTTADIGIELLMDVTNGLAEIRDRITAREFAAVHNPEQGPEVRRVLEELLEVLVRKALIELIRSMQSRWASHTCSLKTTRLTRPAVNICGIIKAVFGIWESSCVHG
jgi:hypothetical protein